MESRWDLVKRIISESDLVIEVLDARLVELSRNEEVERLINEIGRPVIFAVNKSDLVSKKSLKKQTNQLRDKGEVVFISAKKPKDVKILIYVIKRVFNKYGKRKFIEMEVGDPKLKYRETKGNIIVGILGYPNVGKSSIINALAHKKKVRVSKKAGTTHGIHWIKISNEIKLIDSPGVIPLAKEDDIRYGLIGAKTEIANSEIVAYSVIELFLKENKKKFEDFYDVKIDNLNVDEIFKKIGQKRNYLLRGGIIDENRTSSMIVRDWQQGRLRF